MVGPSVNQYGENTRKRNSATTETMGIARKVKTRSVLVSRLSRSKLLQFLNQLVIDITRTEK